MKDTLYIICGKAGFDVQEIDLTEQNPLIPKGYA